MTVGQLNTSNSWGACESKATNFPKLLVFVTYCIEVLYGENGNLRLKDLGYFIP